MRIALYAYAPVLGGTLRHVAALATQLSGQGHNLTVYCSRREEIRKILEPLKDQEIRILPLTVEGKRDVAGLLRFWRSLRMLKHDVIHFHLGNTLESIPAILLARLGRCPVVITEHYLPLPLHVSRRFTLRVKRWLLRSVRRVILLGENFVIPYRELTGVDAEKISVLPPFSEKLNMGPVSRSGRTVGFIGEFSEAKGVDMVIRLTPRLIEMGWQITFCGKGDWEEVIDSLASNFPAKVRKIFSPKRVEEFYEAVDVLLLPSKSEGLPLVVLEAISAGIPVLVTRVGALMHYFADGQGILFLAEASEAEILRRLRSLDDRDFRQRVISSGKKIVNEHFSPLLISRNILELYR